nr:RNA-directed DNA polymerase, eukaryota, reverse transcriptase zinc-binding domain protein [Tanacetum cinerariifolium]
MVFGWNLLPFEHFKNRFEKPNKSRILLERDFVKRIYLEQNDDLEREVSNEEIKRAVWDCGIDKAPRPDGFTFGFYRRPISLIGSLYKVIAKVLENHLVTVLDDIADEIQSAFVTDRQILDVDFEKAYDSVRWDFIDDILRRFGFGEKLSLHGEDEKIGKKVQPMYPSTWLNIINEIESLKLHGIDLMKQSSSNDLCRLRSCKSPKRMIGRSSHVTSRK